MTLENHKYRQTPAFRSPPDGPWIDDMSGIRAENITASRKSYRSGTRPEWPARRRWCDANRENVLQLCIKWYIIFIVRYACHAGIVRFFRLHWHIQIATRCPVNRNREFPAGSHIIWLKVCRKKRGVQKSSSFKRMRTGRPPVSGTGSRFFDNQA